MRESASFVDEGALHCDQKKLASGVERDYNHAYIISALERC